MSAYFTDASFKFLRGLAKHNEKAWFAAHKHEYEQFVRQPFLQLLADLQPDVFAVSEHFRSEPKTIGGSLFRIYRDSRFSNDKSPYKPWQGARIYHERSKQVPAPSFYVHLQPGESFVGAGVWHPEPGTQRRIRAFIFENPEAWKRAAHEAKFRKRYEQESDEVLSRPPRGFPADFAFIDDLKHKNFIFWRTLDDATMTGTKLRTTLAADMRALAPFVDYLCAALDLQF